MDSRASSGVESSMSLRLSLAIASTRLCACGSSGMVASLLFVRHRTPEHRCSGGVGPYHTRPSADVTGHRRGQGGGLKQCGLRRKTPEPVAPQPVALRASTAAHAGETWPRPGSAQGGWQAPPVVGAPAGPTLRAARPRADPPGAWLTRRRAAPLQPKARGVAPEILLEQEMKQASTAATPREGSRSASPERSLERAAPGALSSRARLLAAPRFAASAESPGWPATGKPLAAARSFAVMPPAMTRAAAESARLLAVSRFERPAASGGQPVMTVPAARRPAVFAFASEASDGR